MCLILSFHYYAPTEVVFGPDAEKQTGALVPNPHLSKVREGIDLGRKEKIMIVAV